MPDWRTAYLEQAATDFDTLQTLIRDGAPLCHQLHFLQMTAEKLAKGFLTPPAGPRYGYTHNAFVRFITVAKGRTEFQRAGRFTDTGQYRAYMDSLRHKAQEVEDLSPEGPDHPNPEYPWEAGGTVHAPYSHPFPGLDFKNAQMIRLLQFIADCLAIRDH